MKFCDQLPMNSTGGMSNTSSMPMFLSPLQQKELYDRERLLEKLRDRNYEIDLWALAAYGSMISAGKSYTSIWQAFSGCYRIVGSMPNYRYIITRYSWRYRHVGSLYLATTCLHGTREHTRKVLRQVYSTRTPFQTDFYLIVNDFRPFASDLIVSCIFI